jgi:predicted GNAT family N-acyltransferase
VGGIFVGYAQAEFFTEEGESFWKLGSVFLDKAYTGHGRMKKILEQIISEIKNKTPESKIKLTVNLLQEDAIKLYELLGFKDTGERKFSQSADGVVYEKMVMGLQF